MEPMTLGSPGNVSPSFVPSFLMGEMATAATTMTPTSSETARILGTPRSTRRVSFAPDSPQVQGSPSVSNQHAFLHSRLMTPGSRQSSGVDSPRKGPPIVSLFDTLPNASPLNQSSLHNPNQSFNQSINQSYVTTGTPSRETATHSQLFESELNDIEESKLWVTVFGFPSTMSSTVLTWLSTCGIVTVRHLPSSRQANWMHLRFSCLAEAQRALARDRQLLGPDTMLGVVPCTDQLVMREYRQRTQLGLNDSFSENGGCFLFTSQNIGNNISFSTTAGLNSSMRSLAASPDISVEPSLLPRRTSSVLSKTLDYMFGW